MKVNPRTPLFAWIFSGLFPFLAMGSVLVHFDTDGLSGTTADPWFAGTVAPGVELTQALTRNGLTAVGRTDEFASSNWNATDEFDPDDRYLSFSLRPENDETLWVTGFQFEQTASVSGPGTIRIRMSRDGFGEDVIEETFTGSVSGATHAISPAGGLSVSPGETLEIRIYALGSVAPRNGTASTAGAIRVSNLVLTGVAVSGETSPVPLSISDAAELVFPTLPGRLYKVQGFDGEGWRDVTVVSGSGETVRVFLSEDKSPTGGFRVVTD